MAELAQVATLGNNMVVVQEAHAQTMAAIDEGRWEEARGWCRQALTLGVESTPPLGTKPVDQKSRKNVSGADLPTALFSVQQTPLLHLLGCIELECCCTDPSAVQDHLDAAVTAFKTCITLKAPEPEPYLSLAALISGREALSLYARALDLLPSSLSGTPTTNTPHHPRKASILCSMIELWMTDLCQEPDASDHCDTLIEQALTADPSSPECYTTLASIRISQCRQEDAIQAIRHSLTLWDAEAEGEAIASAGWPAYDARLGTAKLCLELGLVEEASAVLGTCQTENDEDPESWYLFGLAYLQAGVDNTSASSSLSVPVQVDEEADPQLMDILESRGSQVVGNDETKDILSDAVDCFHTVCRLVRKQKLTHALDMSHHSAELEGRLRVLLHLSTPCPSSDEDDMAEEEDDAMMME